MAEQVTVTLEEHELVTTVTRSFEWGNADVFALGRKDCIARLGEIASYLMMMGDKDGNARVGSVTVLLPPSGGRSEQHMHDEIREGVRRSFRRFDRDEKRALQFVERTLSNLHMVQLVDFDQANICNFLQATDGKEVIIVGEAAFYRSLNVKNLDEGSCISEDIWCSHLHHLMKVTENNAIENNNYIILELGEELPLRSSNIELLKSIGNVGLIGRAREVDITPEDVISRISAIHSLVEVGELGKALSFVEADESLSELRKWYMRLTIFQEAGLQDEASRILDESSEEISSLDGYNLVGIADIAAKIGRDDFAQALIESALSDLLGLTELEVTLRVARNTRRQWLVEKVCERLRALHPNSQFLRSVDGRNAARAGDYYKAAELLGASQNDREQEIGELYRLLADGISGPDFSQPEELGRHLVAKMPTWASEIQREIMQSLERVGRRDEAVAMLFSGDINWDDDWFNYGSAILERSLASGGQAVGTDVMLRFIDYAAAHLAAHPNDGYTRTTVADFFDAEKTGASGISVLVMNALNRAAATYKIEADGPARKRLDDIDRLPCIFERILKWLKIQGNGVVQVGQHVIPAEVMKEDPDEVLDGLLQMVEHFAHASNSTSDELTLKNIAAAAMAVAPAANNKDGDLEIVRLSAVQLILDGRPQVARDMAELILATAGDRPARRRTALTAFADIYARLNRSRESLLALIASMDLPHDETWIDIWKEANVLLRVLRDLGLADESLRIIEHLRDTLKGVASTNFYSYRLDLLELHAQFLKYLTRSDEAWSAVQLLESAVANAKATLATEDETLPIAVMMRQLVDHAEADGLEVPTIVHETLEDLSASLAGSHKALMAAMDCLPKTSSIAAVAGTIEPARFSSDVNYDLRIARNLASKLARTSTREADAEGFAYSVELLGAQGVGVHAFGAEVKAAGRMLEDVKAPLSAAVEISELGIPVIGLALDKSGLMSMTVTAEGPQSPVAVPTKVFNPSQLIEWGHTFPYAYSSPRLDAEDFREATKCLGLPGLPPRALILSGDLSRLPPNVLAVEGGLAGTSSALASSPSLAWLKTSLANDREGDNSAAAWIPVTAGASFTDTLSLLAGDVDETLKSAGIPLLTQSSTPNALASVDLAIVGAHGGLAESNRYFRGLSDDRHEPADLKMLTDALRGSRVAILFVCSGGRFDQHPESGGLLGIAHKLLDNGLAAVVAPSWPIPFTIARPWLDAFLNSWNNEEQIIDACFAANNAVAHATSHDFKRSLAMTLYGNPFITR